MTASIRCEVEACSRPFTPGKTGGSGRCSRCLMRKRRQLPDVTEAEAQLSKARAAGEVPPRSCRIVGYIRPELEEVLRAAVGARRFASDSDAVNRAVALLLEREDLA